MRNLSEESCRLLGSLLLFTKYFYKVRTGRDFVLPSPHGRECHFVTISRALTSTVRDDVTRVMINVPPRYGKTEMVIHYIAWTLARYPDSNFLYVSYALKLASKQTQTIREIVTSPEYKRLLGVSIKKGSEAKDNFETTAGGAVYAAGAGGTITGRGAGIQHCNRFGGAIIIDDIHKPDEVSSDTIRNAVKDWYPGTLLSRVNSPTTPIIFIGQRLHEDDLPGSLLDKDKDHKIWDRVVLPALNEHGYPLHPTMHDADTLHKMQDEMQYDFAAQYQQNPQPAGGGLFKPEWFPELEFEPEIVSTFITADTAETDKSYNDATVFSFWGLYEIRQNDQPTGIYGLHWLDCHECRVEPRDLEPEFQEFYIRCMNHRVKPYLAAIEKKSTGSTLISLLRDMQGLQIMDIKRTKESGSKVRRFIDVQPYIASKRVSFTKDAPHVMTCKEHMRKITANDTHRFDDIADTATDAIKMALIDKIINMPHNTKTRSNLRNQYSQYLGKMKNATISARQ